MSSSKILTGKFTNCQIITSVLYTYLTYFHFSCCGQQNLEELTYKYVIQVRKADGYSMV
jgi:hypothetical protein